MEQAVDSVATPSISKPSTCSAFTGNVPSSIRKVIIPSPVWGPGGWKFMESKMQWGSTFEDPIEADVGYQYLVTMMHHLPGTGCKLKFNEYISSPSTAPRPGQDRAEWLFHFHNAVTARVQPNKPLFTIQEARRSWCPPTLTLMSERDRELVMQYRSTVAITDHYNGLEEMSWNAINAINITMQGLPTTLLPPETTRFHALFGLYGFTCLLVHTQEASTTPTSPTPQERYALFMYSIVADAVSVQMLESPSPIIQISWGSPVDQKWQLYFHTTSARSLPTRISVLDCFDPIAFQSSRYLMQPLSASQGIRGVLWEKDGGRSEEFAHASSSRTLVGVNANLAHVDDRVSMLSVAEMNNVKGGAGQSWYIEHHAVGRSESGSRDEKDARRPRAWTVDTTQTNVHLTTVEDNYLPNVVAFVATRRSCQLAMTTLSLADTSATARLIRNLLAKVSPHIKWQSRISETKQVLNVRPQSKDGTIPSSQAGSTYETRPIAPSSAGSEVFKVQQSGGGGGGGVLRGFWSQPAAGEGGGGGGCGCGGGGGSNVLPPQQIGGGEQFPSSNNIKAMSFSSSSPAEGKVYYWGGDNGGNEDERRHKRRRVRTQSKQGDRAYVWG